MKVWVFLVLFCFFCQVPWNLLRQQCTCFIGGKICKREKCSTMRGWGLSKDESSGKIIPDVAHIITVHFEVRQLTFYSLKHVVIGCGLWIGSGEGIRVEGRGKSNSATDAAPISKQPFSGRSGQLCSTTANTCSSLVKGNRQALTADVTVFRLFCIFENFHKKKLEKNHKIVSIDTNKQMNKIQHHFLQNITKLLSISIEALTR